MFLLVEESFLNVLDVSFNKLVLLSYIEGRQSQNFYNKYVSNNSAASITCSHFKTLLLTEQGKKGGKNYGTHIIYIL